MVRQRASQSEVRTKDDERATLLGPWETTCDFEGLMYMTQESLGVMNPEGHTAGTSA